MSAISGAEDHSPQMTAKILRFTAGTLAVISAGALVVSIVALAVIGVCAYFHVIQNVSALVLYTPPGALGGLSVTLGMVALALLYCSRRKAVVKQDPEIVVGEIEEVTRGLGPIGLRRTIRGSNRTPGERTEEFQASQRSFSSFGDLVKDLDSFSSINKSRHIIPFGEQKKYDEEKLYPFFDPSEEVNQKKNSVCLGSPKTLYLWLDPDSFHSSRFHKVYPHIGMCCCGSHPSKVRKILHSDILNHIRAGCNEEKPLKIVSIGSGKCLQELSLITALVQEDFQNIQFTFIDIQYQDKTSCEYLALEEVRECVDKYLNGDNCTITVSSYGSTLDYINACKRDSSLHYDYILLIDLQGDGPGNGTEDGMRVSQPNILQRNIKLLTENDMFEDRDIIYSDKRGKFQIRDCYRNCFREFRDGKWLPIRFEKSFALPREFDKKFI